MAHLLPVRAWYWRGLIREAVAAEGGGALAAWWYAAEAPTPVVAQPMLARRGRGPHWLKVGPPA